VRVISLSGKKSVLGVNVNVVPLAVQDPDVVGARIGNGEIFESGAENATVIGAFAATPVAPFAGVTDARLSAGGAALVLGGDPLDG
jgi:hypothetical protein